MKPFPVVGDMRGPAKAQGVLVVLEVSKGRGRADLMTYFTTSG